MIFPITYKWLEATLILAGDPPRLQAAKHLRRLAKIPTTLIAAADGGADALSKLRIRPHVIIGDNDSVRKNHSDIERIKYDRRKNFTDGAAALSYVAEQCPGPIHIFGALGGRLDHFLGNIMLPLTLEDPARAVIYGDDCIAYYSRSRFVLPGSPGDTVSLIPLTPVEGITIRGMEYPLDNQTFPFGDTRTISNVMSSEQAEITHSNGWMLIIHYPAK